MTERWLTQPYRDSHPAQMDKMATMISRTAVDGLVGCAHAIKKMNQSSILADIKMPTLIIVGEQDVGTPVSAAEFLHRGIQGSKLVVIKNAGHLPNIEQAGIFNRAVLDFLGT